MSESISVLKKAGVMHSEMMPLCGGDDVSEIARETDNGCDGMGTKRR